MHDHPHQVSGKARMPRLRTAGISSHRQLQPLLFRTRDRIRIARISMPHGVGAEVVHSTRMYFHEARRRRLSLPRSRSLQCLAHNFRRCGCDLEQGLGRAAGLTAALLPVLQCAHGNA